MKPSPNPEPFAEQVEWDSMQAEEKERTRRALAYVNAQRPKPKVPYRRARLWQVAILCFAGAVLLYWHFFAPLAWRIFR